jgi:hypothetical protein
MSPGGSAPNSDVDRRQEGNQDDGIKHEEQRIAGLAVTVNPRAMNGYQNQRVIS